MPALLQLPPPHRLINSFWFKLFLSAFVFSAAFGATLFFKSLFKAGVLPPLKTLFTVGRLSISLAETQQAEKLEQFLQSQALPGEVEVSPSAKRAAALVEWVQELAKKRLIRRKIFEQESKRLGVDLTSLRKAAGAATPVLTADGRFFADNALAADYRYDELLTEAAREKVEGFVELNVISIAAIDKPLTAPTAENLRLAKEFAQKMDLALKENPNFSLADFRKNETIPSPIVISQRRHKTAGLDDEPGFLTLSENPYGFEVVKITKIEKGLRMTLEEWYEKVKGKYL